MTENTFKKGNYKNKYYEKVPISVNIYIRLVLSMSKTNAFIAIAVSIYLISSFLLPSNL